VGRRQAPPGCVVGWLAPPQSSLGISLFCVPTHVLSTPACCDIHIKTNNKNLISTSNTYALIATNNVLDSSFDAAIAHSWSMVG
jgi:hypothetical protein